ncbi:MAG: biotin--[acetyl-CoA-carboxylase] ligase [Candidatus Omnitrophica bacterium]|nr:biotin--[acetyl-CoA-carboxylase] ligase [Candidatus Omnitrophota bacterium]MDD5488653.1 biotin--[acetyl-CoA-carboxylase] ligase [Candidatus Omnitrophota bacterium]
MRTVENDGKIAKLIDVLMDKADEFVSGEEISRGMGITRAAIWKYMDRLRSSGYIIEASPRKGYMLKRTPDKMLKNSILHGLGTSLFGKAGMYVYDAVGSTNDKAYEIAEGGAPEGVVVIAEQQTSGKGRVGRKWASPPGGGIYASIILRPGMALNALSGATLVAAAAVCRAIRSVSGADAGVKWPNDIFVRGRKVCGILSEMKAEQDMVDFLIVGIGVNVNTPLQLLPEGSTSLKEEAGDKDVDRNVLLAKVLEDFESRYSVFRDKGFASLVDECREMSIVLGKEINVMPGRGAPLSGTAVDIDEHGALVIRDASGALRKIYSGDIEL